MDVVTLGAALSGAKKYTDDVVHGIAGGITYKGEVNYYSNLPSNPTLGDAYTVKYSGTTGSNLDGTEYVWAENGGVAQWVDFSKDSYTKAETDALLGNKQDLVLGSWTSGQATIHSTPTSSDTVLQALEKIDNNQRLDENNILLEQAKTTGMSEGGSNYITVGGIRVYVSATAPTGARIGDLWIGG